MKAARRGGECVGDDQVGWRRFSDRPLTALGPGALGKAGPRLTYKKKIAVARDK